MELDRLREEIDRIDGELARLLEQRLALAGRVGAWKRENRVPVHHPVREARILENGSRRISDPALREPFREIMRTVLEQSRAIQEETGCPPAALSGWNRQVVRILEAARRDPDPIRRAGYPGIPGSYSQEALERFFPGPGVEGVAYPTFAEAVEGLRSGGVDALVLPIENSSTGGVRETESLLSEGSLWICGETFLRIRHVLLGLPGSCPETIQRVTSHPEALSQCSRFLEAGGWVAQPYHNTAASARRVREEGQLQHGAIASEKAGTIYGLDVLARDIGDTGHNSTRFVMVRRDPEIGPDAGRVSLRVSLSHEVGSLHRIIRVIAANDLNMTRIESRPIHGRPWEYYFFIDFEGNFHQDAVQKALEGIARHSAEVRMLGNYPKGDAADEA